MRAFGRRLHKLPERNWKRQRLRPPRLFGTFSSSGARLASQCCTATTEIRGQVFDNVLVYTSHVKLAARQRHWKRRSRCTTLCKCDKTQMNNKRKNKTGKYFSAANRLKEEQAKKKKKAAQYLEAFFLSLSSGASYWAWYCLAFSSPSFRKLM